MEIRLHDSVRRQIQRHKINKWLLEAGGERVGNYYNTNGYNIPFREAVLNLWVMTPLGLTYSLCFRYLHCDS